MRAQNYSLATEHYNVGTQRYKERPFLTVMENEIFCKILFFIFSFCHFFSILF